MSRHAHTADASFRDELSDFVHHLEHVLPAQAPLRDFVHHNTLHAFQHLDFAAALRAASELTGARCTLPASRFREFFRAGRIDRADLEAALDRHFPNGDPGETVFAAGGRTLTRRDVLLAALLHPVEPVSPQRLAWAEREELHDDPLWAACRALLPVAPAVIPPAAPEEAAPALWQRLRARIGRDWTLRNLLAHLGGADILDEVRPALLRHVSSHLDQGFAAWHAPGRERGLYAAWREASARDPGWVIDGRDTAARHIAQLPADAADAIGAELAHLGLERTEWTAYLERLALELPGWSGMVLWRGQRPDYRDGGGVAVAITDYLALRLVLDRIHADALCRRLWGVAATLPALAQHFHAHPGELWLRHACAEGALPEHLAGRVAAARARARDQVRSGCWSALLAEAKALHTQSDAADSAARAGTLRQLALALGLDAAQLDAGGEEGARALLDCAATLDEPRAGFIWLNAYEGHYREQIFAALAANHGRWKPPVAAPSAQLVFCMDDREEGTRRHLEEIDPEVETYGAAGFFGIAMNWRGVDDEAVTPLCPVVVTPAHEVREVAEEETALARHRQRRGLRLALHAGLHRLSRTGLLAPAILSALAAPAALAALTLKSLAPGRFAGALRRLRLAFDLAVPTRLALDAGADAAPATPRHPRPGFTDVEQADRVESFLRAIGLVRRFAPLVVLVGHGSGSQNNPHMSAYDCGACSGRHGGPNARAFAAMANRAEVRALLAARGIAIPETTRFVGAEHNTCDESFTWYDAGLVPAQLGEAFARLRASLDAAALAHAAERCRRFASAAPDLAPQRALRHIIDRAADFAQTRPELGHANNACAFIGRRDMSRGAFFDRRVYLISYDPADDADGRILENILLAAGPVGAGISLEYYFSTVDNDSWGSGSKITHNLAGFFGVMDGTASDLRTGLPRQMVEIHEAMRLLVVVEHKTEILSAIVGRQPPLQELIGNGWLIVAAKDPDSPALHLFDPQQGWLPWQGHPDLPTRPASADWFAGRCEPLPPALLQKPLGAAS